MVWRPLNMVWWSVNVRWWSLGLSAHRHKCTREHRYEHAAAAERC